MKKIFFYINLILAVSIIAVTIFYPIIYKDLVGTSKYSLIIILLMVACLSAVRVVGYLPEYKFLRVITHTLFVLPVFIIIIFFIIYI